jgi:hypothetical protein
MLSYFTCVIIHFAIDIAGCLAVAKYYSARLPDYCPVNIAHLPPFLLGHLESNVTLTFLVHNI